MIPAYPAHPACPPPPWGGEARAYPGCSGTVALPPMATPLVPPAEEPESASVVLLRKLLADRRNIKNGAEFARNASEREAVELERQAAISREAAKVHGVTIDAADTEIAAILADIKALGGRDE